MKCFNWKVIAALAAIGIGLYALAPGAAAAAVPLLILAACPLSMLLMMRAMGSVGSCKKDDDEAKADEVARLRAEVSALRAERQTEPEATCLAESPDGGRSSAPVEGPQLAFLSWGAEQGLWGVSPAGETYRRVEGRWEPREALAGQPQALLTTSCLQQCRRGVPPPSTSPPTGRGGGGCATRTTRPKP